MSPRLDVDDLGPDDSVLVISMAAELSGLHAQTLRTYDRMGLVSPERTRGGGRRYSLRDVAMLRGAAAQPGGGRQPQRHQTDHRTDHQVDALRAWVRDLSTRSRSCSADNAPESWCTCPAPPPWWSGSPATSETTATSATTRTEQPDCPAHPVSQRPSGGLGTLQVADLPHRVRVLDLQGA